MYGFAWIQYSQNEDDVNRGAVHQGLRYLAR
jgi:hypothetical protein